MCFLKLITMVNSTFIKVDINDKIKTAIPNIDLLVKESISQIDDVIPAYKRGQPVKIALKMPLLITNED